MPEQRVAVRLSVTNGAYNAGLGQSVRETDRLTTALERLDRQMRALDRRPIRVNATLDSTQLEAELRRLSANRTTRLDVRSRLDTSSWAEDVRLAAERLRVRIRGDLQLGATTERPTVQVQARFAPGTEARLQGELDRMTLRVRVRPDLGPLPNLPGAGGGGGGGGGLGRGLAAGAAGLVAVLPQAVSLLSSAGAGATVLASNLALAAGAAGGLLPVLGAAGQGLAAIKIGTSGVVGVLQEYVKEQAKLNSGLEALGPNQRAFVAEAKQTIGVLTGIRGAVGERLFAGLDDSLRDTTGSLLPLLREQLLDTAGIANSTGRDVAAQLAGPLKTDLGGALRLNNDLLLKASPLFGDLLSVVLDLYVAAGPLATRIVEGAAGLGRLARDAADAGRESGALEAFFDRAGDRAGELLRGLGNLGGGLRDVFRIGNEGSVGLLGGFERLTQRFQDFTSSTDGETRLRRWFAEGAEAGAQLRGLLSDVRREFAGITGDTSAAEVIGGLRTAVPYVRELVDALSGGGDTGRVLAATLLDITQILDAINVSGYVKAFVGTLSGLAQAANEVLQSVPGAAEALTVLTGVLGTLAALKFVGGGLLKLAPALVFLASPVGVATLALGGLAVALAKSSASARETERELRGLGDLSVEQLLDTTQVDAARDSLDKARGAVQEYKLSLQGGMDGGSSAELAELEKNARIAEESLRRLETASGNVSTTVPRLSAELGVTSEELVQLAAAANVDLRTASYDEAASAIGRYRQETGSAADASRGLTQDLTTLGDEASSTADKADALRRVLDGLNGGQAAAEQSAIAFRESLVTLTDAIAENGAGLGENTAAGRANSEALLAARDALNERLVAAARAGAGEQELKRILDEGTAALGQSLLATKGTKEEIERYQGVLGLTPEQKATQMLVLGRVQAESEVDSLQRKISGLTGKELEIAVRTTSAMTEGRAAAGGRTGFTPNADGNVLEFAGGGMLPSIGSQQPRIEANRGPRGIMWAETGAGPWEAFVSGHPAKRERSRGIAAETVRRLGGVAQFADGGIMLNTRADSSGFAGVVENLKQVASGLMQQAAASAAAAGTVTGGGLEQIKAFIQSVDPLPYIWGAVGPRGYDCSGLAGEVMARHTGRPSFRRYFTTGSFGNGTQFGFKPGRGGTLALGFTPGTGHVAGEYGGLPFEAASTRSGIKIGAAAKPVSSFARQFHMADGGILDQVNSLRALYDVAGDPSELVIDERLMAKGSLLNPHVRDQGGPLLTGFTFNGTGASEPVDRVDWVRGPGQAAPGGVSGPISVNARVFIGDREITDIVRVEAEQVVNTRDRRNALDLKASR